MKKPKIFIGTMYSGEGDFDECKRSVIFQEGVTTTHHIISGMDERSAHNALWAAWNDAKETHDLFVKLDADTVLATPQILLQIWDLFDTNSDLTSIQAPLHDYMTDDFINGLNSFHPDVFFRKTDDPLYCDRVDYGHRRQLLATEITDTLKPAGYHCHHSTYLQAFHYGLHRMLKKQRDTIEKVQNVWKREHDSIRALALAGARAATSVKQHNYTDAAFHHAYHNSLLELDIVEPNADS